MAVLFVSKSQKNGVKQVSFIECLKRKGESGCCRLKHRFNTWNEVDELYNERVAVFNSCLKALCEEDKQMNFEPLSRFREYLRGKFIDGVHLDWMKRDK